MKLWILSSSLLILIIIGLRFLLKGKISFRVQYVLWLIVLLRLLIPFSVGRSPVSVENVLPASRPVLVQPQQRIEPDYQPPAGEFTAVPSEQTVPQTTSVSTGEFTIVPSEQTVPQTTSVEMTVSQSIDYGKLLQTIWMIGAGVIMLSGIISNLLFQRKLRRSRTALSGCKTDLPVYIVQWLSTPCLAGLFRPSIYLTEEAVTSPVRLRHVLAHEKMHYKHGDHFWAWMRLAALALHWFNPLVWAAAILSKRDAELACDEAVLRKLGADERHSYGETLLSLSIPHVFKPFSLSTSMSESKKSLRERIVFIARSPHMKLSVLLVLILLCSAAVSITFPGSAKASFTESNIQETLPNEDVSVNVQPDSTQKENVYFEEPLSTPSENNTAEEPAFPVLPDVPNAEQQYQLLMDQHEKWEFMEYSWWYTFTDLDHNGRLEVIADYIAGSSFLTYSHCFEVNENMDGIVSCLTGNQNYSILQIQEELPCYFDASSGLYYYINEHRFNISGAMHHSVSTEALCLHNGFMERIGLSYKQVDYENYATSNEVLTLLLKDGDGNVITEDEYNTLVDRRFAGMEKSMLPLIWEKSNGPIPVPTPDPMKVLEERPENIFPPSVLASAAAREASLSAPIVITNQPTNATITPGGETSFIARADHATGICWRFISPEGQEYSLIETLKLHPGLSMNIHIYDKDILSLSTMPRSFTVTDGDYLSMSNVPASLNGWGIKAAFYGPNTVVESSVAYLTVYEPVMVFDQIAGSESTTENNDTIDASVDAYYDVINSYREVLEGRSTENEYISKHDLPSSHIGYALKDLDENGIPELLLYYDNEKQSSLFDMFTLVDNTPARIPLYGMRSYFLRKDNTILYYVHAGEHYNFYTIQRLNGDKLEDVGTTFEHSSRADDDRFYYQPGEVGTMPSDRSIHLSLEEYNRILAEYKDSIYIPSLTKIH